jgi:accessory gene regulator protein AgrB
LQLGRAVSEQVLLAALVQLLSFKFTEQCLLLEILIGCLWLLPLGTEHPG